MFKTKTLFLVATISFVASLFFQVTTIDAQAPVKLANIGLVNVISVLGYTIVYTAIGLIFVGLFRLLAKLMP